MSQKIELKDYNPQWEKWFEQESKEVKNILGKNCVAVVHVGSTAIKGMKSRNCVDLMVLVKDIFQAEECKEGLEQAGYMLKESYGDAGRHLYVKEGAEPAFQLHFYENEDYEDIQRIVAFRDYLEAHKEIGTSYAALKEEYALQDEESYQAAKGTFIKETWKEAIPWHEAQHRKNMALTMGGCSGVPIGVIAGFAAANWLLGIGAGILFGCCIGGAVFLAMKKKKTEEDC